MGGTSQNPCPGPGSVTYMSWLAPRITIIYKNVPCIDLYEHDENAPLVQQVAASHACPAVWRLAYCIP